MFRVAVFVALVTTAPHLSPQAQTRVFPFYSATEGSGFAVECRNPEPGKPLTLSPDYKFDGVQPERRGSAGTGELPTGDTWLAVMMLHAQPISTRRSIPGMRRRDLTLDLKPGPHKIAFSCGAAWSHEITFYWEGLPR